ncbi:mechanosensitive ion channel family protein [Candidatus Saccharibacteria bacterium]|nr:mechanosensitive ion channel family protein [Candidatus Saccharibacteria bacterium]
MDSKPKVSDLPRKLPGKRLSNKRKRTYMRMLKSIVGTILVVVLVLIILQAFGINVSSMLASVGVVSVIVGFALQDALKDIIRGFEIISSNYYDIGDLIKFGDNLGQVQSITLRTTKIQDINTMNIVSIANRNIDKVEVDTGYIYVKVPLPYELKVEKADAAMREIAKRLGKTDLITSASYQGLSTINDSSLDYQVVVTCEPMNRLQARRNALHVIVETLEEAKISIPYTQLDLHNK